MQSMEPTEGAAAPIQDNMTEDSPPAERDKHDGADLQGMDR